MTHIRIDLHHYISFTVAFTRNSSHIIKSCFYFSNSYKQHVHVQMKLQHKSGVCILYHQNYKSAKLLI